MNVYEIVTNKIIAALEEGIVPWHKTWKGAVAPCNFVTKTPYRGMNLVLLSLFGGSTPYYLTFNQVQKLKGQVRPGSKSEIVIFWNWLEKENERGGTDSFPLLRYYRVFNLDQTTGIDFKDPLQNLETFSPIERAEHIVNGYVDGPAIEDSKIQKASYSPFLDRVQMPLKLSFDGVEEYYATLFHELVHSTGHQSRLGREGVVNKEQFGSENYSKEELIAEIGASILCNMSGIGDKVFKNSVSYIQNWLGALKNDKRLIILAAGQAQKAVDRILQKDLAGQPLQAEKECLAA